VKNKIDLKEMSQFLLMDNLRKLRKNVTRPEKVTGNKQNLEKQTKKNSVQFTQPLFLTFIFKVIN